MTRQSMRCFVVALVTVFCLLAFPGCFLDDDPDFPDSTCQRVDWEGPQCERLQDERIEENLGEGGGD